MRSAVDESVNDISYGCIEEIWLVIVVVVVVVVVVSDVV